MKPKDYHSPFSADTDGVGPSSAGTDQVCAHGHHLRQMKPESVNARTRNGDPGRFGRIFDGLPPLNATDAALQALAEAMAEAPGDDPAADNSAIPAGYTYFGQFVDHDITLDTTPLAQQIADQNAVENFRTPALDLDSL